LRGKTIGLIGYGKIARGVCDRLSGWGVAIKIYSRRPVEHPSPDVTGCGLEELLRTSDIVSIHAGLDKDTRGLMNEERLRMMKTGSIFINTARGAIVDEQALARVARDGTIARIALDSYVVDPLPMDSPLRSLPNAILTPNMLGHTQEGAHNFIATAIESVLRVLRREPPVHVVNPEIVSRWQERWADAPVLGRA
jgi:D-3-phosphoglycerate dehydrogenase